MVYEEKPKEFTSQFSVVSCVFDWKRKTLLLHRRPDKSQGGKWGMPSGKVNCGEKIEDAMTREIHEETSLSFDPKNLLLFKKFYVDTLGKQFEYYLFHLKLFERPAISINRNEHDEYKWVDLEEVLSERLVADHPYCMKKFLEEYDVSNS